MQTEIISALNKARRNRQAAIVVSDLSGDMQGIFLEGDEIAQPEIAKEATDRFRSGKSGIAEVVLQCPCTSAATGDYRGCPHFPGAGISQPGCWI